MDIHHLLARSSASDAFKLDTLAYARAGRAERIRTTRQVPSVKVLRVVAQLLHSAPDLPIERITVDAWSGCSDFSGMCVVELANGTRRFEFTWCCRWRAEQEGWTDYFGFPDQMRAAREFDWQCFSRWRERVLTPAMSTGAA